MTQRKARLAPAIAAERRQLMAALQAILQMLGGIVGPHIEVVLHDLTQPAASVVGLRNGHVSNRRLGASILSGPEHDKGFAAARDALGSTGPSHSLIADYMTVADDGKPLKSATVVFRDSAGGQFAALCINADMSSMQMLHVWLQRWLGPPVPAPTASAERPEMDELMEEIIGEAVRRHGKPISMMSKDEKVDAVRSMLQRGVFIVKGSVERAARALGVSRFTIYNYLEAARQRESAL